MTSKRATKRKTRFDYAMIVARVEKARKERGISTRALSARIGVPGFAWYRKIHGSGSSFTLEEFGAIADALDAPEGWPLVDWQ